MRSGKGHICSVVPPTESAQAIRSIFSPKIQLRPNWQPSRTKMAVAPTTKIVMARLKCDADSS